MKQLNYYCWAASNGFDRSSCGVMVEEHKTRFRRGSVFSLAKVSSTKFRHIEQINRATPKAGFLFAAGESDRALLIQASPSQNGADAFDTLDPDLSRNVSRCATGNQSSTNDKSDLVRGNGNHIGADRYRVMPLVVDACKSTIAYMSESRLKYIDICTVANILSMGVLAEYCAVEPI